MADDDKIGRLNAEWYVKSATNTKRKSYNTSEMYSILVRMFQDADWDHDGLVALEDWTALVEMSSSVLGHWDWKLRRSPTKEVLLTPKMKADGAVREGFQ